MSKHDLKSQKIQVKSFDNKEEGFIETKVGIRIESLDVDTSDPLSYVTKTYVDSITNDGAIPIALWDGEPVAYGIYRSHMIDGIEYLFRSNINDNTDEPSLTPVSSGAWIQTDLFGFISTWNSSFAYSIGNLVTGDANSNVYRSKINGNTAVNPDGGLNPDEWELVGAYIGFYFPGTFNLGDVVIVSAEGNRIYISAIADNEQPITDIVGPPTWQIIGSPSGGGSAGNPTSGTLLDSDSPLVITWDTDLVPDDTEGRTYFEKHGPLEKVSIQVTMPDPANDGEVTVFPSWRFDEATKNILTIDNQGQKLYYVIGFGTDGNSGGGGTGDLTNANFVDGEEPAGDIDGTNVTYTLANTPVSGSVKLYLNGLRQRVGAGNDYTITGSTITMADPLEIGDILLADYRK